MSEDLQVPDEFIKVICDFAKDLSRTFPDKVNSFTTPPSIYGHRSYSQKAYNFCCIIPPLFFGVTVYKFPPISITIMYDIS